MRLARKSSPRGRDRSAIRRASHPQLRHGAGLPVRSTDVLRGIHRLVDVSGRRPVRHNRLVSPGSHGWPSLTTSRALPLCVRFYNLARKRPRPQTELWARASGSGPHPITRRSRSKTPCAKRGILERSSASARKRRSQSVAKKKQGESLPGTEGRLQKRSSPRASLRSRRPRVVWPATIGRPRRKRRRCRWASLGPNAAHHAGAEVISSIPPRRSSVAWS